MSRPRSWLPVRFFHSVRFRLTLWYLGVLALILCAFGLTVYYAQQHTLSTEFDTLLRTRIQQIALTYDASTQRLDLATTSLQKPTASKISATARGLNVNEVVVLLSPQGQVLQEADEITPASRNDLVTLAVKSLLASNRVALARLPDESLTLASSGKPMAFGLMGMPIIHQQHVVAYLTFGAPSSVAQQLSSLATTLLIAGALVLLLAALGGLWLANRAMRPVQAITATAEQIGASDLSRRLALKRRDELGELAGAFDHMLDRLEGAFTRQRQFTADASHELRTPLTIIELKASRLLEQSELTEQQRAALTMIQQEREHMTTLIDDLLFLARADGGQTRARLEVVHLDELLLDAAERFAPLAQQHQMRIDAGDLPDLTVLGDRLSLLRMLGNLIENALKYSGTDGTCVRLDLAPCEQDSAHWAQLTVSDDGPGIPDKHLPHVFERFYRADPARTHSNPTASATNSPAADAGERAGSGLGLAITREIALAHGGAIALQPATNAGTICIILLPLCEQAHH
jgi:two-component system, OmpR family, sensor kinase